MVLQTRDRVTRARGLEATCGGQHRREKPLIEANHADEQRGNHAAKHEAGQRRAPAYFARFSRRGARQTSAARLARLRVMRDHSAVISAKPERFRSAAPRSRRYLRRLETRPGSSEKLRARRDGRGCARPRCRFFWRRQSRCELPRRSLPDAGLPKRRSAVWSHALKSFVRARTPRVCGACDPLQKHARRR